ncbi:winged helix-turn-helix domain-containing protein [Vibrio alfacsensis]|uniref:winged helix-turn-helix domain-containing protein n=1 Tax=Vibrio TaxID=662 RepID=UPI0040683028
MTNLSLEPPVYKIGDISFSPTSGVIEKQGDLSRLRAREANLLHALIKTFPDVLSRASIEETLWKDSYATNATINQTVKALRFSLQDVERNLIRTIPKQGYVLSVAPQVDECKEATERIEAQTRVLTDNAENVTNTDATLSIHHLPSLRFFTVTIAVGIASFALSASGLFVTEPSRVSHQQGKHWVLFDATPDELETLQLDSVGPVKYVVKQDAFYRVCSQIEGVLKCQKVDF